MGSPTALSEKDREWMTALHDKIWRHSKDQYGFTHSFPVNDRKLPVRTLEKVRRLIKKHTLPCVMSSGPYGELTIRIHDHLDVVAPGEKPPRVLCLFESHLGIHGTFATWRQTFAEMSKFTHHDKNRQVCEFYNLPLPEEADHYAY